MLSSAQAQEVDVLSKVTWLGNRATELSRLAKEKIMEGITTHQYGTMIMQSTPCFVIS